MAMMNLYRELWYIVLAQLVHAMLAAWLVESATAVLALAGYAALGTLYLVSSHDDVLTFR